MASLPEDDVFPPSGIRSQIRFEIEVPPNISQGARAGQSGTSLEGIVETIFAVRGVRAVKDNPEYHCENDIFGRKDKFLVRQVCLKGWRVDFLYIDFKRKLRVPIECKQQLTRGTTDEKLPHTVNKLVKCGCDGFWLVVGGGGHSRKMIATVSHLIAEVSQRHKIRGHLVFNEGPFLQRAVDRLVERGEI